MHYMLMPLYNRAKNIIGFTALDEPDYRWAREWRWSADRYGYPLHQNGGRHFLHREITRCPKDLEVDHIDRNPRNNLRSNLRTCTHAQNHQNKGGAKRGVTFDAKRGRWVAKHKLNGKTYNLGRFLTETEAAEAAARFRAEHMPFSIEGR